MTQTVPDISPLMPMHQDPLLVIHCYSFWLFVICNTPSSACEIKHLLGKLLPQLKRNLPRPVLTLWLSEVGKRWFEKSCQNWTRWMKHKMKSSAYFSVNFILLQAPKLLIRYSYFCYIDDSPSWNCHSQPPHWCHPVSTSWSTAQPTRWSSWSLDWLAKIWPVIGQSRSLKHGCAFVVACSFQTYSFGTLSWDFLQNCRCISSSFPQTWLTFS